MKVNHDKKLIFIHIPKCAGGAIKYYFDMEAINKNHESAHMAQKNYDYWNEYTKFTVIRNPWEAELSFFFYRLSNQFIERLPLTEENKSKHIELVLGGLYSSLKSGVIAWDWWNEYQYQINAVRQNPLINSTYKLSHDAVRLPFSMMRYITSNHQGKNLLNEIIRYENLQGDLNTFCNKYDVEPTTNKLEKINETGHLHYSNYYTKSMIDYVYRKNKDYIEYFGYKFEKDE